MSHHKLVGRLKTVSLTREDLYNATGTGAEFLRNLYHALHDGEVIRVPVVPNLETKIYQAVAQEASLKRAKMCKGKVRGVLEMENWHGPDHNICGTTHCRLGWAEFFGGAGVKKLHNKFYDGIPGALIYLVSTGRVPDFDSNLESSKVLKDIRARALMERKRRKPFKFVPTKKRRLPE